jgi:hypothetical protein
MAVGWRGPVQPHCSDPESEMMFHSRIAMCSLLLAAIIPGTAAAQTISIGSATVSRGSSVSIPVEFVAGPVASPGFQVGVAYDPARVGHPTCAAFLGAVCHVNRTEGRVRMIAVHHSLLPLPSGTYMRLTFDVPARAARGVALLGAETPLVSNAAAQPVEFVVHSGQLSIR